MKYPEPEYANQTFKILNNLDEVKEYLETI